MTETFKHRLDIYYLSTIAYGVTLVAYGVVRGTLIGDEFSLVWKDPIVYLLAAVSIASVIALIIAAISRKKITINDRALIFGTRFRERSLGPEEIEWIGFRRERVFRGEKVHPMIKIKLRDRRRLLRLRPGSFERSEDLANGIAEWGRQNGIEVRSGRSGKKTEG